MENDLELMNIQAEVLYVHDHAWRLTIINEPISQPAPRFFWGQTKMGQVLRFRSDVPDINVEEILHIMDQDDTTAKIANVIHALGRDKPINRVWLGPAYVCHIIEAGLTDAVLVTEHNKYCLEAGFPKLASELTFREPCFMVIENDMAVSVCFSARSTARAAEAGVETLEGYRGKGYARSVTSSWSRAVHESRRIPLYSTSWDNYASQSIARRLNLYLYGTDVSFY
ncbi:GNAT family N-acetyltransferase [Paenibacillus apiarius]|uniref:GNAT family N-acetyltransferase n=1 Tax=Paenibacillus apiarius TaxID=46240 RepID=UPI003B3AEC34